jgi:hypothetical protein
MNFKIKGGEIMDKLEKTWYKDLILRALVNGYSVRISNKGLVIQK